MNPDQLVDLESIKSALNRIRGWVQTTPVKQSYFLENFFGQKIYLKLENLNISGSFKIRGASNAVMQLQGDKKTSFVVAASAGNHAQGIAYACSRLSIPCRLYMPQATPIVKVAATKNLGAEVVVVQGTLDEAFEQAQEFCKSKGGTFIHPFADPQIICGQGTVGLEICHQLPDIKTLLVPVGGGGLLGGVSTVIKQLLPHVKIIGVQSEAYPAMSLSKAKGKIVDTLTQVTIADGIAVKKPQEINRALMDKYVDEMVTVEEKEISGAIMQLFERDYILAEGAGAVGVAALRKLEKKDIEKGPICCIISGGNMDINLFQRVALQGLAQSGRHLRLRVMVEDKPGELARLLSFIGDTTANLLEVKHNRILGATSFYTTEVDIDMETSGPEHQKQIQELLAKHHFHVKRLQDPVDRAQQ